MQSRAEFDQGLNCGRRRRKSSCIRLLLFTLSGFGRPFSIRATLSSFGIEGFSRTQREIKICAAIKEWGMRKEQKKRKMRENREVLQVTVCHESSSAWFFHFFFHFILKGRVVHGHRHLVSLHLELLHGSNVGEQVGLVVDPAHVLNIMCMFFILT